MNMKQLASRIGIAIFFSVLIRSLLPRDAYAYLEPGTGSYIFQVILAALLGALFMLRVYWARITGVLRGRITRSQEVGSQPGKATETSVSASESTEPTGGSPGQRLLSEEDDG